MSIGISYPGLIPIPAEELSLSRRTNMNEEEMFQFIARMAKGDGQYAIAYAGLCIAKALKRNTDDGCIVSESVSQVQPLMRMYHDIGKDVP